jgi:hypothetical protein
VGEVTSIGGNCSGGVCCACAPEMPSDTMGTRKLEASRSGFAAWL